MHVVAAHLEEVLCDDGAAQLTVEQLPVKEQPGAAHQEGDRGSARVVSEKGHLHTLKVEKKYIRRKCTILMGKKLVCLSALIKSLENGINVAVYVLLSIYICVNFTFSIVFFYNNSIMFQLIMSSQLKLLPTCMKRVAS